MLLSTQHAAKCDRVSLTGDIITLPNRKPIIISNLTYYRLGHLLDTTAGRCSPNDACIALIAWVRVSNINMTHANEDGFTSRLAGVSPSETES
jgi:hypothetical protein